MMGLSEDIAYLVDFIDQFPESDREALVKIIRDAILDYKIDAAFWQHWNRSGKPKDIKTIKRKMKADVEKRIKTALKFIEQIETPIDDSFLSEESKGEIVKYAASLFELKTHFDERMNESISLRKPNKDLIVSTIKQMYQKYNFPGADDTIRNLLPHI